MNFNGFGRGGLVLTVPQGWTVVLHFKNEDPNLPHSVEVIPDAAPMPVGPVTPAFEHATTGRLDQGFSAGQGGDVRFVSGKRSEEHTSELQSQSNLVCRLLLEKK